MRGFVQDLRYGMRMLRRAPGFTAVAVATLAVGIGANSTIFSVVQGVLLRPLPFEEPGELALVWTRYPSFERSDSTGPDFAAWRERNRTFKDLAAHAPGLRTFTGGAEPERLPIRAVTVNFFDLLGVAAAHGRTFIPGEDRMGSHLRAVLSDGFWKRQFGSDPAAVGRAVELEGRTYEIVGILPEAFRFGSRTDVWVPLPEDHPVLQQRGEHLLRGVGRLREGVTLEAARSDLSAVAAALAREFPDTNEKRGVTVDSMHQYHVKDVRATLLVLFGAVSFVLLIACVNVANLLLGRTMERHREIAVRTALGAGRLRLFRQLATEGILLSALGGGVGVLLALWGLDVLGAMGSASLPRAESIRLDGGVLLFTLGLSLATGLGFGLAPSLYAFRSSVFATIKEGLRLPGRARRIPVRSLMVSAEVALSLVLLIAAGLLTHSFVKLLRVDPGFETERLLSARIMLPESTYPENAPQVEFARATLERIETLPGVRGAGAVSHLPLAGDFWRYGITVDGRSVPEGTRKPMVGYRLASTGYFRAVGIPVLQGRTFDERDTAESPRVLVINETMAKQLWPDESPLGRSVEFSFCRPTPCTVVGVVGDVKHFGLDAPEDPAMYGAFAQKPEAFMRSFFLLARTTDEPERLAAALKQEIWALDPDLPVSSIASMEQTLDATLAPRRFLLLLLSAFAYVAVLLTAVGVYGVLSASVSQRTREFGVRMALGARPADVLRLVLRQGLRLVLLGLAVGLAGALGLTRFLESMLFGIEATDPPTFALISALLVAVALLACYLPARRATRVDPMSALRYE